MNKVATTKNLFRKEDRVGTVTVKVIKCSNLANKDFSIFAQEDLSDPYTIVSISTESLGSQSKKTRVIDNNLNPEWDETFTFDVYDPKGSIIFDVFDKDNKNDDFLGEARILLATIVGKGQTNFTLALQPRSQKDKKITGEIILDVNYVLDRVTEQTLFNGPIISEQTKQQFQQGIQNAKSIFEDFKRDPERALKNYRYLVFGAIILLLPVAYVVEQHLTALFFVVILVVAFYTKPTSKSFYKWLENTIKNQGPTNKLVNFIERKTVKSLPWRVTDYEIFNLAAMDDEQFIILGIFGNWIQLR